VPAASAQSGPESGVEVNDPHRASVQTFSRPLKK
jgi:hypothetical protein